MAHESLKQRLLARIKTGVGTVVLATASLTNLGAEELPAPTPPAQNLTERIETVRQDLDAQTCEGEENVGEELVVFLNGAFRNGGGGFRNSAFRNGGGFGNGGAFRNGGGFANGGFRNGGFANGGGFRNGGFANGSFRNW